MSVTFVLKDQDQVKDNPNVMEILTLTRVLIHWNSNVTEILTYRILHNKNYGISQF